MASPSDDRQCPSVEQLIEQARTGSKQALGQLLDGWRDYLLLLANQQLDSVLSPKGGPSDLVQQTFLEAQLGIDRFQGGTEGEFVHWLRIILENNAANLRRRYFATEKRDVSRELPLSVVGRGSRATGWDCLADTQTPSACAVASEEVLAFQQALARLPEAHRRVIRLRHEEGYSFAEIGRRMGRSSEAARKLWSRAIKRLTVEFDGNSPTADAARRK